MKAVPGRKIFAENLVKRKTYTNSFWSDLAHVSQVLRRPTAVNTMPDSYNEANKTVQNDLYPPNKSIWTVANWLKPGLVVDSHNGVHYNICH